MSYSSNHAMNYACNYFININSAENVFSSLVGLRFNWSLMPQSIDGDNHLLHIPLKETPLSDCGGFCGDLETQIQLEDNVRIL